MEPLLSGLSTFFSWLMDYTVDISILICLIFIIKSIASKKLPAWFHYSLWIILLLRMIIPWKFESPLIIPNVVPISINEGLFESILIDQESIMSNFTTELSSNPHGWHVQVDAVLLFLWLACAIFLGMHILVKNIKFLNIIKKAPLLTEKKVLNLLEECQSRMRSHIPLKITITDKVRSPALFGYIRPRLLLPVGVLEKLDDAELYYIFMHELGHLKRHDIGVSWIITFLQIFHWFNPLVWLAFHQMRIDQESACDASVLSRIKHSQTINYASTIIGFLENFCRNRKLPALVGILERQTQLKKRITMIINYRRCSKIMMFFTTTLLIIIGGIFFSLAGFAKEKHERPGLDSSIIQTLPSDVRKDMATHYNDAKYEKEAVRFSDGTQRASFVFLDSDVKDEIEKKKQNLKTRKALVEAQDFNIKKEKEAVRLTERTQKNSIPAQDSGVKDEIEQEKQNLQTQKALVEAHDSDNNNEKEAVRLSEGTQKASLAAQDSGVKGEIGLEKQNLQTQKALVEVQENKNKEDKEEVRLTEGTQKISANALKVFKEGYYAYPEDKDILKYYPVAPYKNEQIDEAALMAKKNYNTSEEKSMKYLDSSGLVYYESENQDYAEGTLDLHENESNDGKKHNYKGVYENPKIVSKYSPRYPFEARTKGIEGRVLLRFIVDRAGNVLDPQVVSAEPEGTFEQAALDTVTKYKFKPAKKDGKYVKSIVKLAINFTMNNNYLKFAQK